MSSGAPVAETWAVIPVKSFDRAKMRLADLLGPAQRAGLAKAMLCDVLAQIEGTVGLAGILVVTCDPEAVAIAQGFGAQVLTAPIENGINDAVLSGLRVLESGGKSGAVVVPGDLPFITAAELRSVLLALEQAPVVLAPAARDRGTNILALSPPGIIAPAFGPESFARHFNAAVAAGLRPAVLTLDGAGHDIDVAADLAFEARSRAGSRTRACLRHFETAGSALAAEASF